MGEPSLIAPYSDGRWFPLDNRVSARFPLVCRGNTGEVFPNVVTPLTGSIVMAPFGEGQMRFAREMGMGSPAQLDEFAGPKPTLTPVFGGYLYANVSFARSAVARTPGLTSDLVDHQMFGLSDAPPYVPGPGDRDVRLALRASRTMFRALLRPDMTGVSDHRVRIESFLATAKPAGSATTPELLDIVNRSGALLERSMYELLRRSAFAGLGRSLLERIVAPIGGDDVVNRLTAGLGTIESAEPATVLWRLGRMVAADDHLTGLFDAGMDQLPADLLAGRDPALSAFTEQFAQFQARYGSRGPNEWELASSTWGTDPRIGLAMVDRLRNAPESRDPVAVGERLAADRTELASSIRGELGALRRRPFDIALRAATLYQSQREAAKATAVQLLYPLRLALAELARRSAFAHDEFFMLAVEEVGDALGRPEAFEEVVAERGARRDYLQARIPPFWFEGPMPSPETWQLRTGHGAPDATPRTLSGLGVCSGVASGPARIVTDPSRPDALQPGDILVAPLTDPAWTPLFLAAAGVVVDVGAQQSHAAIVARELGIPAVVSVSGASATIADGAIITVDGSGGSVTVHPRT